MHQAVISTADPGPEAGPQTHPASPPPAAIPTTEGCLRALAQLPGLIALRLLTPAQASAIRANYQEILRHHRAQAKEAEKGLADADVLELLRQQPKLLNLIAPLLTSEQVEMVLSGKAAPGS